jgi:tetratricopeptide (TPR) repeat protein
VVCAVAVALASALGGQALGMEIAPPDEVCGEAEAYSHKVGKAERKRLEEEAKQDARIALAESLWAGALRAAVDPGASFSEREFQSSAGEKAFPTLRKEYRVLERLDGGVYRARGDRKSKTILYCVSQDGYETARAEIRDERARRTEAIRLRMAALESLVGDDDLDEASRSLTALEIDVVREAMENLPYESTSDGRERPVYVWLLEWADVVPRSPDLPGFLTERARDLLAAGHVEEAERYLAKALEVDRSNDEARRMREEIQDRRNRLADVLGEAEELARAGRITAAEAKLGEAEELGAGDQIALDETTRTVEGLRAEYLSLNPRASGEVFAALGSLGVDTGRIEQAVAEDSGEAVNGSTALSAGFGGKFRMGRYGLAEVTGSFGTSEESYRTDDRNAVELYVLYQVTAGAGFRTRRTTKRSTSYQLLGGLVWESARINEVFRGSLSRSGSQTGFFVGFTAEWKNFAFFVRHGFGFDDREDSLVRWSGQYQFGVAGVF